MEHSFELLRKAATNLKLVPCQSFLHMMPGLWRQAAGLGGKWEIHRFLFFFPLPTFSSAPVFKIRRLLHLYVDSLFTECIGPHRPSAFAQRGYCKSRHGEQKNIISLLRQSVTYCHWQDEGFKNHSLLGNNMLSWKASINYLITLVSEIIKPNCIIRANVKK